MQDRFAGYSGTFIVNPDTSEREPDADTAASLRDQGHPDYVNPDPSQPSEPAPKPNRPAKIKPVTEE